MITLTISGIVVTGNQYLNWHWSRRSRYIKDWLAKLAMVRRAPAMAPDQRALVTFTCYRARTIDRDNLSLGLKPIRDALKRLRYIYDDNEKWGEFIYNPVVVCKKPDCRLVITIEYPHELS